MDKQKIASKLNFINLLKKLEIHKHMSDISLHFGQLPILEYIAAYPGCTQSDISEAINVSPASVATSTKRLNKAGFITKTADSDNLRRNKIYITEPGLEQMKKCRQVFDDADSKMLKGFSDEELNDLINYTDRMIKNLNADANKIDFFTYIAMKNAFINKENKNKKCK